jgi:hypothetical protein
MNIWLTFIKLISQMTMKGFTGKTQKKKLAAFTLDLLSSFYLNRYFSGVYNRLLFLYEFILIIIKVRN